MKTAAIWHHPSWADALLDLRPALTTKPILSDLPDVPDFRTARTGLPGWTVLGYEDRNPGTSAVRGSDSYALLRAPDGTRTAIVVARKTVSDFGAGELAACAPGFWSVLTRRTAIHRDDTVVPDETRARFERLTVLHDALLHPHAWLGLPKGAPLNDADLDDLSLLPGWASMGVRGVTLARGLREAGLNPKDLDGWRQHGFEEIEAIAWGSHVTAETAARYRPHLDNPRLASLFDRHGKVHPQTAAAVHAHGWSASFTAKAYTALVTHQPYLKFATSNRKRLGVEHTGDHELIALAAVRAESKPLVLLAIAAGLRATEVAAQRTTLDPDTLAALAALRS